jgi:hypothetical protein
MKKSPVLKDTKQQMRNWFYHFVTRPCRGCTSIRCKCHWPKAKGPPLGEIIVHLAPTFTSIGGVSVKSSTGLNASLRYRYLGNRPSNEANSVFVERYFILDA